MKRISQYIFFLSSLLVSNFAFGAGGEIGNGFVLYNNQMSQFSMAYPKTWTYLDLEKSVRFLKESTPTGDVTSKVAVTDRKFKNVQTTDDLLSQIQFFHPNLEWERVTVSDYPGFQSKKSSEGVIYVLRESERIISIRFDTTADLAELDNVKKMIGSLEIR